ncbi:amidase [Microcoleus sp. FACHB-1515]|uniref:amidase n=1 Tax=Cyanophyceae TaxID=3028117 RepID=UPI0016873511|nr:amidase [Microcoleus sp. FACHB-1515]MBD2093055.1 amidase [Microcoleus sp. FACHB-1515]
MDAVDLAFTSALDQARLIRQKEISPLELTELYLERIDRLNPQLGAFFTVMSDRAIDDAKAKTEQLATATDLPPLFGVPISIKDLAPVADVPCSYGVKILRNRIDPEAGVVTRIRKAGCIVLGKTATSQLGSTPFTEPKGFPPARNPWNLDYTPGGSSGGAAAAVAAGLGAIAHGSDGGGSIRGPAFCCGLVGIKPARGRVSHAPVGDKVSGLATDGAIARTVRDAAALLDAMSGHILGDPYWLPDPESSFLSAADRAPRSLRIAYATEIQPIGVFDPVCTQVIESTVQLLEEMGHSVESIALDFSDLMEPLIAVWQAGVDVGVPPIFLDPLNRWLRKRSRRRGMYLRAVMQMQACARKIVAQLDPFDVLVLTPFLHQTIRVGEWANLRPVKAFEKIVNWVAPSPPFNATGQPAIAIPTGFAPNGLPVGVQLIGRPADEATLISLAAQIEATRPWQQHRPAIDSPKLN